MKYKVIAIIGKSGSGKDTIFSYLRSSTDFNFIVRSTTRPMRPNEVNGVTYNFMTEQEYAKKFLNFEFVEVGTFRDWFYGTEKSSLDASKINIGIFDVGGVEQLKEHADIDLYIFYITAKGKVRLIRSLSREKDPDISEIFRRYKADEEDFADIGIECELLTNETLEDLQRCVSKIKNFGQSWSK